MNVNKYVSMKEQTKEQRENSIFEIFSKWRNSTNPTETKEYCDQFREQIDDWYKNHFKNAYNKFGRELKIVIDKITSKDRRLNIPKDKEGFFKYFHRSLKNEKINTYRKFNEKKSVDIPKDVKSRLKELAKFCPAHAELGVLDQS